MEGSGCDNLRSRCAAPAECDLSSWKALLIASTEPDSRAPWPISNKSILKLSPDLPLGHPALNEPDRLRFQEQLWNPDD